MVKDISEEISQQKFESEHHKGLINLMYTHNHIVGELNTLFKNHGITRQQFNVLRILRGQHPNPVSINLIKERMIDKMSDASRIVERLRLKDLLVRTQCDTDRRSVDIAISDNGLKLLAIIDGDDYGFDQPFKNLSKEEAKKFNELLDKIRA